MNQVLDNLHMLVVHAGRICCGREWNFRDVCSPFTRIYLILSGKASVTLPTGELELLPGHMYIIPAFTPHSCCCPSTFEHCYIHLYNEAGAYTLDDWTFPASVRASSADVEVVNSILRLCPDMELTQTDPGTYDNKPSLSLSIDHNKQRPLATRLESRGLIYLLLARFLRDATPKRHVADERISAVVSFIRANLREQLDLEELASMAHLSKDHLIRLFKREMGVTPVNYINARRIEAAQLMLLTRPLPVKEIAYLCGFDDHAYFSRLFRKISGVTPLRYRNNPSMP